MGFHHAGGQIKQVYDAGYILANSVSGGLHSAAWNEGKE